MTLVDSLLTAMERASGDALVMHVGERPYVIAQSRTIDVSAHALGVGAMNGMLAQLLPAESRAALDDLGAVEHVLPERGSNRFTVVAARGGEDIWIEIRRRQVAAEVEEAEPTSMFETVAVADEAAVREAATLAETPAQAHDAWAPDGDAPEPEHGSIAGDPTPAVIHPDLDEPDVCDVEDDAYVLDVQSEQEIPEAGQPESSDAAAAVPDAGSTEEVSEPAHRPSLDPAPDPPPPAPLTRTVRIEVPHMMTTQRLPGVARLIRTGAAAGATELFLTPQARPYVRVDGNVRPMDEEPPLTAADIESFAGEIAPESLRAEIRQGRPIEWLAEVAEVGRVRFASFSDHRGAGLLCRIPRSRAASIEQLDLGEAVMSLATEPDGLVIVAGAAGSGKSAIVSAFVDAINRRRADYVITLEPEVRIVHEGRHALISQREVAADAGSRLAAARAALREEPDVLVIEGVDSPELFELAVDAAGRGLLVIASVTSASAADAMTSLVEGVEPGRRAAVSARLADVFRGAVSQLQLRKTGGGRLAAREVVLASGDVSRALADPSHEGLPAAIESGRGLGMTRLIDALVGHVRSGAVDLREAYRKAPDRWRFVEALRAAGVDTTIVDRLA